MKKEEYLDIVDEKNNPTGESKLRYLVHSTGLWHRTIHIYVFHQVSSGLEVLVHLRAKTKDLSPNKWDTRFGGHIKSGENIGQATIDEIKDEIGIVIKPNDLIEGEWRKKKKYPNNEFSKIYYFEFERKVRDLKFNDGEVQKVKWLSIRDIKSSMRQESDKWAGKVDDFNEIIKFLENKLDL